MAAFSATGPGSSSPMSWVMASPSIRYGGDSTVIPRTDSYQATAASTSGTHTPTWARPLSIRPSSSAGSEHVAGVAERPLAEGQHLGRGDPEHLGHTLVAAVAEPAVLDPELPAPVPLLGPRGCQ